MMLGHNDVHVNLLPLYHIMDLSLAFGVLYAGGKNVIIPKYDAKVAAELIARERASIFGSVPPILSSVLDQAEAGGHDLSSLRIVASLFDDPATIKRLETSTPARFWTGFGQTETTGYVTLAAYSERPGSS